MDEKWQILLINQNFPYQIFLLATDKVVLTTVLVLVIKAMIFCDANSFIHSLLKIFHHTVIILYSFTTGLCLSQLAMPA